MSDIRVTYTGFLSFFISIITIITGTIFSLILTRSLTQEEFGIWGLISGLIGYIMIINLIISFWSTRETARKIESGKTAILGMMILSVVAITIYILISAIMGNQTGTNFNILLLSSLLIPPMFLNSILTAINLGHKPHVISHATLAFGVSQIPLGLFLIHYLDYGVEGVIISNIVAYSISAIISFKYAKGHIKNQFKGFFIKSWFRLSWIPLYPGLFEVVDTLGIVIYSTVTGSVLGIAIWAAANIPAGIIKSVTFISRAVYPKLLEGGNKNYLGENITHLFYFNFLMTGTVIVFAKPALFALNPIYQDAYLIVILLALRNFFFVLTKIFIQNLGGYETVDTNQNATFAQYRKSKLFYPHTLRLVQASSFVSILLIGIIILFHNDYEIIKIVEFWAALSLVTSIPLSFYLYIIVKRVIGFTVEYKIILKYFLASIISFSLIHFMLENFLVYHESVFEFIPYVLSFLVLGVSIYFALTFLLDYKTRDLCYSIIKEIRGKIR